MPNKRQSATNAFHASCVSLDGDGESWLVGFADSSSEPDRYFILERAFEDDEQDITLGMNSYHIERDDQRWSMYGGVRSFKLSSGVANIAFSDEGVAVMGMADLKITFQLSDDEFGNLKERLLNLFANSDCRFEYA
jgi:hypothetical protein